MPPFRYQIILLGQTNIHQRKLEEILQARIEELGINPLHVAILSEQDYGLLDSKAPIVAVFFGYSTANDNSHRSLVDLLRDSITIIPFVDIRSDVLNELPSSISHINAYRSSGSDSDYARLVTLILENLRLLRSERRLFISYKRSESQSIAIQLYEAFDKAGFEVFLDTRSVPYGAEFQNVLWHRMADCDIVVLLDTPNFRASHWTQLELSQANATNIQILHILWPDVEPDKSSAFSQFRKLKGKDFAGSHEIGAGALLADAPIHEIVVAAESLRARAMAARHRSLVDNFCDRALDCNVSSIAIQPERFIAVQLKSGYEVAVVPTIGIPRADRYQELDAAIRKLAPDVKQIWLLYDERGILESWLSHLDWLNSHLPTISVRASKCADRLV